MTFIGGQCYIEHRVGRVDVYIGMRFFSFLSTYIS